MTQDPRDSLARHTWVLRCVWMGVALLLVAAWCRAAGADGAPRPANAGPGKAPRTAPGDANAADKDGEAEPDGEDDEEHEEHYLRGAELSTDFEADSLLKRARELLAPPEPQYHKAALVLQHLIDTAGDALATEDHLVYHPVRRKVELVLSDLPDAGLAAYRAEVDGQVRALVASPGSSRDETALRAIAERFFLSSSGDEAAFALACLYLDQHQFLRARRVLLRVLRDHPQPSVPRAAMLVRLALAAHRSGDVEGARAAWKALEALGARGLPAGTRDTVRREVFGRAPGPAPATADGDRALRPTPLGLFPEPPANSLERPRGLWLVGREWPFALTAPNARIRTIGFTGVHVGTTTVRGAAAVRDSLLARWEQSGWHPTGALLFRDGLAYFKSHGGVLCVDAATGKVRWQTKPPTEKTTTRTSYVAFHFGGTQGDVPRQTHEVLQFGDRLGKALGLVGDTLYHLEDHHRAQWSVRRGVQVMVVNGKRVVRPQKKVATGNRLAALDARSGKVRWRLGRTLDEGDPFKAVRFLAMPVPCGGRLLVPVETQNELFLAALDPGTGRQVWRTFLCAYTSSVQAPWYGVGLARNGSEVYVATGQGVVLGLDGIDGAVRWASRYERNFEQGTARIFYGRSVLGWHENRLFAVGRRIVVLPSDAEQILTFDAHTGGLRNALDTRGLRYCLGLAHGSLFVGSDRDVRRLALDTGRTRWRLALSGARRGYGHAFLADGAVYVPSGRNILRVAADTGKVDTTLRAELPDGELVGNVFSDGQGLFVYGLGRVYRLKSGALEMAAVVARLAQLQKQLAAAAPEAPAALTQRLADAHVARARLHVGYGRLEPAAGDYRVAAQKLGAHKSVGAARDGLFRCLLALAERRPQEAGERVREALAVARTAGQRAEATRALAALHERQGNVEEAVGALLSIARSGAKSLLELEAGGRAWRVRPDVLAAAGVRRLLEQHGGRVSAVLAAKGDAALTAARGRKSFAALQAVLRSYPGTGAAVAAGVEAARLEETGGVVERAELVLREMIASPHAPTAAGGLAALAAMHQRRGWLRQAKAEWTHLAEKFPQESVATPGGPQAAGELARKSLADKALADLDAARWAGLPKPPWRRLWTFGKGSQTRYVNAMSYGFVPRPGQMPASQFLEEHLFLLQTYKEGHLVCKRLRDGKTVYDKSLGKGRGFYPIAPYAHVVALGGTGGTTVFGLASGKALWSQKMPSPLYRPINVFSRTRSASSAPPSTHVLVVRPDGTTVRVIDLATGGTLWERTFRGVGVGWAQSVGRHLVLSTGRNQELCVCDALTGDLLSTIKLKGRTLRTPQATPHGILCESYGTNAARRTVALYELPSGKARWHVEGQQSLRGIHLLNADTVCLLDLRGSARIVDLATGRARATVDSGTIGGHVRSVALDRTGNFLYLNTYGADRKQRLVIVDLKTGKPMQSIAYGVSHYFRPVAGDALTRCDDLLPVIVQDPPKKEGNRTRASTLAQVKFLDRTTGKFREDLKLPVGRPDGKVDKLRSLIVQDGVLVLLTYGGLEAYGHDPKAARPEKGPAKPSPPKPADPRPAKAG